MPPEHRRIAAPVSATPQPSSHVKTPTSSKGVDPETSANGPRRPANLSSSYSSSPYSHHAMQMPYMMMGMQGSMLGGGNNPIAWVYSLNQTIYSISYALDMIGMNNQAIQQLYQRSLQMYIALIGYIKRSRARIWLQEKCKRSKLLRALLVCSTMFITFQIMRLVRAHNSRQKSLAYDILGAIKS